MKTLKLLCSILLLLGSLTFAQAQTYVDDMEKEWERAKAFTKEYLDAMPESGYAFKPTADIRSFAEQMLHITDANYGFASAATGAENPIGRGESENTADKSKANVTLRPVSCPHETVNN